MENSPAALEFWLVACLIAPGLRVLAIWSFAQLQSPRSGLRWIVAALSA